MPLKVLGRQVGEVLIEFLKRWGSTLGDDLDDTVIDLRLNDFVDDISLQLANNPGLPLDGQRVELRALLGLRVQVLIYGAIIDPDDEYLTVPDHLGGDLLAVVGAIFGRLLAGARVPAEWNGRSYGAVVKDLWAGNFSPP